MVTESSSYLPYKCSAIQKPFQGPTSYWWSKWSAVLQSLTVSANINIKRHRITSITGKILSLVTASIFPVQVTNRTLVCQPMLTPFTAISHSNEDISGRKIKFGAKKLILYTICWLTKKKTPKQTKTKEFLLSSEAELMKWCIEIWLHS